MKKSAGAGAPAAMGNHDISEQKHRKKMQANERDTY
jgi:hypothetical protein